MPGRVLTVSESDSSGGSGIQADIKTVLALGGYAMTAIAALTAQNTRGVVGFQTADPEFVSQQMRVVLEDMGTDAIKTGILGNEAIINAVADVLDDVLDKNYPVVVDPAIVARNGEPLMDPHAIATLKRRLLVRATVITPNRKEAEILTGMTIRDLDDMRHAADMLRTVGAEAVVLKGGQINSEMVVDLVATGEGERIFESSMQDVCHTHGAGDTLAAALAVSLSQGLTIFEAMERSLCFLNKSIETAHDYGHGVGPVNHAFEIEALLRQRQQAAE